MPQDAKMIPILIVLLFLVSLYRVGATLYLRRAGKCFRPTWLEALWPTMACAWYVADGALLAGANGWTALMVAVVIPSAFSGALFTATTATLLEARRGR